MSQKLATTVPPSPASHRNRLLCHFRLSIALYSISNAIIRRHHPTASVHLQAIANEWMHRVATSTAACAARKRSVSTAEKKQCERAYVGARFGTCFACPP
eukprot:7264003-Prymnesium_polylepis.1